MRWIKPPLIAIFALIIAIPTIAEEGIGEMGAHGLRLPATFTGVLPCADCPGVDHHLNLWPDQVFHLRRTWLERDMTRYDIGRWSVDPERKALMLHGGAEMPLQFEIRQPNQLRQLNFEGKPIESELPYELVAAEVFEALSPKLMLHGEFVYMADAPRLTECLTGRSYPVAMEGDYLALERAYLDNRAEPGAPLMATFEGQISERPPMEGDGTIPTVIVDRFVNVWALERCERWRAEPTLTNTYWKIVRLNDQPIQRLENTREPHLLLNANETRFRATVGCNRIIGTYATSAPEGIRFTPGPMTIRACPPPLDEEERRLVAILGAAHSYRPSGQTMEVFDGDGKSIALFQAVYF
jgi:heat shock protein HslJ/uncharacterized lipoprotein NlpE involved in copper resistance